MRDLKAPWLQTTTGQAFPLKEMVKGNRCMQGKEKEKKKGTAKRRAAIMAAARHKERRQLVKRHVASLHVK